MPTKAELEKELLEVRDELRVATLYQKFFKSDVGKLLEADYAKKVAELDSIRGATLKEKGVEELMGRQIAIAILESWMQDKKDMVERIPDLTQSIEHIATLINNAEA